MKKLVIVPTYNECDNIVKLIEAIRKSASGLDILVVDDNSPDGTGKAVQQVCESQEGVFLLSRPEKKGLGKAYLDGFRWGLDQGYDVLIEMDADFSHRPVDLVKVAKATESADFVVGSRYVSGGKTVNWGVGRRLISRAGSLYARLILWQDLNDWTGGFNGWSRKVLLGIGLENIRSEGYSFQIELKYKALRAGFKGQEVPIVFEERREGKSKMSLRIVLEAFYRVWVFRFVG